MPEKLFLKPTQSMSGMSFLQKCSAGCGGSIEKDLITHTMVKKRKCSFSVETQYADVTKGFLPTLYLYTVPIK